jgi:hypothetical protein
MLSIALPVAMLATTAMALPEPKVSITYSLETPDGGGYYQKISETSGGIGDVDFVFDVVDAGDPNNKVDVLVAGSLPAREGAIPMRVTIEFTADAPGGNIVDGPVEIVDAYFEREWVINSGNGLTIVTTDIDVWLSRKGTGDLLGSTITWDNTVAPYQESASGQATCTGFGCLFASPPFPRDLSVTGNDVPLPTFTVLTNTVFGDSFASDNGTPGDPSDDIDRPDAQATVKDTWVGVEVVPEPSRETLLLAGVLGLVGLGRLRERGDRRRSLREPSPIGSGLGDRSGSRSR